MAASVGFGLVIGLLLGLLGGGGSILAVPALVYGIGQPVKVAIPTSLLVVGISSLAGATTRLRARVIQWRLVLVFATTGAPAAFLGSYLNRQLPTRIVLVGFAALMLAAGWRMLADTDTVGTACAVAGGRINWRRCLPRAIASGFGVGLLTGLFGVGGGFLLIPALVLLLGLDMTSAVATSLVIVALNSASAFAAHLDGTHIDAVTATTFTTAAVLGAISASRFGKRLPTSKLQRWFAYLVFAVAALVLVEVLLVRSA